MRHISHLLADGDLILCSFHACLCLLALARSATAVDTINEVCNFIGLLKTQLFLIQAAILKEHFLQKNIWKLMVKVHVWMIVWMYGGQIPPDESFLFVLQVQVTFF